MITDLFLRGDRSAVIANIKRAATEGRFNDKVETNDPVLDLSQERALEANYLRMRKKPAFWLNSHLELALIGTTASVDTRHVRVVGRDNLAGVTGGAVVTSNHFSPGENLMVRKAARGRSLQIVGQLTNLEMGGFLGYLMTYGTLPISSDAKYMGREFPKLLGGSLQKGNWVLIYPEQEMWFQYRRPRPPKRGAYYYAARFNVPVVSCFVTMRDTGVHLTGDFNRIEYTLHILKTLRPDPKLSVRDNSLAMMQADYAQKCELYETTYGEAIDAPFSAADIVGWHARG